MPAWLAFTLACGLIKLSAIIAFQFALTVWTRSTACIITLFLFTPSTATGTLGTTFTFQIRRFTFNVSCWPIVTDNVSSVRER
jgi:hypothetical protein